MPKKRPSKSAIAVRYQVPINPPEIALPDPLQLESLKAIGSAIQDAVLVFDQQGILRYANQAAADLLGENIAGLTREQLAKTARLSYPHGGPVPDLELPSQLIQSGESIQGRFYHFTDRDGKLRSALISATPIQDLDGSATGVIVTWKDITEEKKLIEEIEILESIADGFFAIDRDWKYIYVNQRAAQAGGLHPEDLIGEVIWERWPQILGTQLEKHYRYVMEERLPVSFEYQGILTNTWYEIRVYPSLAGISVYWIDITNRKQMENRLAYKSLLLNTIHEAVMSTGVDERIVVWNQAAEELTGWTAAEVRGKLLSEVVLRVEPQTPEHRAATWNPLREGKAVNQDVWIYRKDGSQILVATTTVPVFEPEGQLVGFVSAARDITEQRRSEEELQRAYSEMESRVRERTRELTELQWRMLESLEAERLRVSRELHDGPVQDLYGLMYQTTLLEGKLSDPDLQAELKNFVARIQEVNENLRTIAYDLRPVSLTQLGLGKAIREYVSRVGLGNQHLELELELQPDDDILPESCRLALFRVCQVGVSNIVRHSAASQAKIHYSVRNGLAVLEISDNGQGFEVPKNLLSLARQGHLGLVGAAERVEALGGTFELHSKKMKGTRLAVCVPLNRKAG